MSAGDRQVQRVRRTEDVAAAAVVVLGFLHDVHLDALVVRGGGDRGCRGGQGGGGGGGGGGELDAEVYGGLCLALPLSLPPGQGSPGRPELGEELAVLGQQVQPSPGGPGSCQGEQEGVAGGGQQGMGGGGGGAS